MAKTGNKEKTLKKPKAIFLLILLGSIFLLISSVIILGTIIITRQKPSYMDIVPVPEAIVVLASAIIAYGGGRQTIMKCCSIIFVLSIAVPLSWPGLGGTFGFLGALLGIIGSVMGLRFSKSLP
jgi:hypothetical protein